MHRQSVDENLGTALPAEVVPWWRAIAFGRKPEALVPLLDERHTVYRGRGIAETERLRGHVLARFEEIGLPIAALSYVFEELESGLNPYTVAGAAKALRGAAGPPQGARTLLLRAFERMRYSDDSVCFDRFEPGPAPDGAPSVLMELVRTLGHPAGGGDADTLAALASGESGASLSPRVRAEIETVRRRLSEQPQRRGCCPVAPTEAFTGGSDCLDDILVEDQSGATLAYAELFGGRPAVITFFYTRCMNPAKCSLTVTKLGRLRRRLEAEGVADEVTLAAFTYDPAFDRPRRLLAYGADRGVPFSDRCRLLRAESGFDRIAAHFELGVGYGPVTVNRHRIELFVTGAGGEAAGAFVRAQWSEDEVAAAVLRLCRPPPCSAAVA